MSAADAQARAERLYGRAPALQAAYVAGARAAMRLLPRGSNPYRSKRGFGPAFRQAWATGYDYVAAASDDE